MSDYRINWEMPLPPVGGKVAAPVQTPAPDPIKLFETGSFEVLVKAAPAPAPTVPLETNDPYARVSISEKLPWALGVYEVFQERKTLDRFFCYWNGQYFCKYVTDRHTDAIQMARQKTEPTKLQITEWRVAPESPLS
jgi:hypothetical protein